MLPLGKYLFVTKIFKEILKSFKVEFASVHDFFQNDIFIISVCHSVIINQNTGFVGIHQFSALTALKYALRSG